MEIGKLPEELLLNIFLLLDTESKLRLGNVNKTFRNMIFTAGPNVLWKQLEISVTTGERTIPLLHKLAPCICSLTLQVSSDSVISDLPCFSGVVKLSLVWGDYVYVPTVQFLASRFPVLKSLRLNGKLFCDGLVNIANAFSHLEEFFLDGVLYLQYERAPSILAFAAFVNKRLSVKRVEMTLGGCSELLDCLAGSKTAPTVQELELDVAESTSPKSVLIPFTALKALYLDMCFADLGKSWMNSIRRCPKLEHLRMSHLGTDEHPAFLHDSESLPTVLSTIFLDFLLIPTGQEMIQCLAQRVHSLKNLVLCTLQDINFDLISTVRTLIRPDTHVEYLFIKGWCRYNSTPDTAPQDIYAYLTEVGPSLTSLRFLYLWVDILDQVLWTPGFDMIALQNRLPAGPGQCIVQLGGPREFQEPEKDFIRSLDGWKQTKRPCLDD